MSTEDATSNKRTKEQTLYESKAPFRQLFEQSVDALFIHDEQGRLADCNTQAQRLLGYSREELLCLTVADLSCDMLSAEERARAERPVSGTLWQRAMSGEPGIFARSHEEELRCKDGTAVAVEVHVGPIDYDGRRMILSSIREISERRQTEAQLKESEERFRTAFENASTGIALVDLDNRYWKVNRAFCEMLGYEEKELLGKRSFEITHPEDLGQSRGRSQQMLADDGPSAMSLEKRYLRRDGSIVWAISDVSLVRDADENPSYFVTQVQNITRRKRAEEDLERERSLLRTVIDSAHDPIFAKDLQHRFLLNNAVHRQALGAESQQELLGKTNADVWGKQRAEPFHEDDLRVIETGEPLVDREERVLWASGEVGWFSTTKVPLRTPEGSVEGLVAVSRDITERKHFEEALKESELRFRQLFEQSVDAVIVHDAEGDVIDANQKAGRSLGYTREELLSMNVADYEMTLLSPEERAERERYGGTLWQRIIANEPGTVLGTHMGKHRRKDGTTFPVEAHIGGVDYGGRRLILSSMRDITERKQAEEAVREGERRLRTVTSGAPVILFAVDREGTVTFEDGAALQDLGMEPGQSVGCSVFEASPAHPQIWESVHRALAGEKVAATVELRGLAFDTRYSPVHDRNGELEGVIAVATNITDRYKLQKELEHQALHDLLTALPNRTLFMGRLQSALVHGQGRKGQIAVLFVDLDDFKIINDSLGHHIGDSLLVAASTRLRSCLRSEDTLSRFGGDEFVVLLHRCGLDTAEKVARRVAEAFEAPFFLGEQGYEVFTTASVGIATYDRSAATGDVEDEAEELLKNADLAMYQAKEGGKNRHEVFDPSQGCQVQERLKVYGELRRAMDSGEFTLRYQPIVRLADGHLVGMEALLRWEHPERGLLRPAEFISVAEQTGLIIPLGRWVLQEACRQTSEWPGRCPAELREALGSEPSPLPVSVNLSARQLVYPELVKEVSSALEESGLEPPYLELEITENATIENDSYAETTLRDLEVLGVKLAVDDFGTGYSSISYLRRFPVQTVKIDRSIVAGLGQNPQSEAVVSAIIDLAHSLGKRVIAEGIESPSQLGELRRLGCELGQGEYFLPPLPVQQAFGFYLDSL